MNRLLERGRFCCALRSTRGQLKHFPACAQDDKDCTQPAPAMKDLLRIYVLWHPESGSGQAAANAIAKHFDGLGMERDGVAYRVPVRFRSEAWDRSSGSEAPGGIPWEDAEHNAIVLLHDELTARDEATWDNAAA